MGKKTILRQDKYRAGTMISLEDLKGILDKYADNISIEMKERAVYSDKSESIIVKIIVK